MTRQCRRAREKGERAKFCAPSAKVVPHHHHHHHYHYWHHDGLRAIVRIESMRPSKTVERQNHETAAAGRSIGIDGAPAVTVISRPDTNEKR